MFDVVDGDLARDLPVRNAVLVRPMICNAGRVVLKSRGFAIFKSHTVVETNIIEWDAVKIQVQVVWWTRGD